MNEAEGGEKPLLLHRSASFVAKACPRRLRPMPFLRESEAVETLESQSDEAARREPAKSVRLKRNNYDCQGFSTVCELRNQLFFIFLHEIKIHNLDNLY
ncbi:hypothetical protein AC739_08560 [Planococcus glaciei]|nr:hypothetical protein AC739_08560 [Planococcus glaciei]